MNSKLRNINKQPGATMVETAMIIGVLIILIFSVLELARFYSIKARMARAVKKGLEYAIRDERMLNDAAGGDEIRKQLKNSYYAVDQNAVSVPVYGVEVAEAIHNVPWYPEQGSKKILIIRPGEQASYKFKNSSDSVLVDHPTAPAGTGGSNMAIKMETDPILVEMHAKMKFLLPFMGEIPIQAQALGYAEKIKRGIEGLSPQTYDIPSCGDGKYDVQSEQCDNNSAGTSLRNLPDHQYCHSSKCQVRNRCGNGIVDSYGGYIEECDFGDYNNNQKDANGKVICDSSCKLPQVDGCENYKVDGNEQCDIALEDLCVGYKFRKEKNQLTSSDQICTENESSLLAFKPEVPPNSKCIKLTNPDNTYTCRPYQLPTCNGEEKEVICEGECNPGQQKGELNGRTKSNGDPDTCQRPGQQGRFKCTVCGGGPGKCDVSSGADWGLAEACKNQNANSSNKIKILEGLESWACQGCNKAVDQCGNGKLDLPYEQCDPNSADAIRTILDHEYCNPADCQIANRCGNQRIDSYKGYFEECDTIGSKSYDSNRNQLLNNVQCTNLCKIQCGYDAECDSGNPDSLVYLLGTRSCICTTARGGG